uniref:KN17 SH3-like C-terminal domain-containing protein n=1 Tax=Manihot esculenta TaxID=3983 RepID=A0A2C9UE18_MANES
MKLSFSITKSAPKPTPKSSSEIDTVSLTQTNDTVKEYVTEFDPSKTLVNSNRNLIIPPKENEWRPHKRMKNLDLLPTLQSDPEGLRFEGEDDKGISYGLNVRQQSSSDGNKADDVKVEQYHKRTDKEGLGFVPPASNTTNTSVRDRDSLNERKIGRDRDDQNDDFFGKYVRVIAGGRDIMGLKGRISKRLDDGRVVLKLSGSDKELKLHISDIADLGSKEEERCLMKLKALQIESKKQRTVRRDTGQEKDERKRWLRNHIRVGIISKDLKGGRFYLKKGEVVDVIGPHVCDITMGETKELVEGVDEDLLETALPRRGGPVVVLYGKRRGMYGNLVERDLDQETGVAQDADTHELLCQT